MDLGDKVAIITGATDGLGKAVCLILAQKKCELALVGRNEEKLLEVKKKVETLGARAHTFVCEISDSNQIKRTIQNIKSQFPRIEILVNSAGVWIEGELEDSSFEDIENAVEVNTLGTILFTKGVSDAMKIEKRGFVINIISQSGLYAKKERSIYDASKWAITGFTKSLQQELSVYGIKVTGVYPGPFKSGLFEKAGNNRDMQDALEIKEVVLVFEFLFSLPDHIVIPEIGIKSIKN